MFIKAVLGVQGPVWLTGGAFGVEASAPAVIICLAAGIALLYASTRRDHIVRGLVMRARAEPS